MTDPSDFDALAKRFLDLWQEQATAAAADPAIVGATQRMAEMTAAAPTAWFALWTQALQAAQHAPSHGNAAAARPDPRAPDGAAAARAASGGGAVDLGEFVGRLAALEQRVAELERRGPAVRKPRSRKPVAAAGGSGA